MLKKRKDIQKSKYKIFWILSKKYDILEENGKLKAIITQNIDGPKSKFKKCIRIAR